MQSTATRKTTKVVAKSASKSSSKFAPEPSKKQIAYDGIKKMIVSGAVTKDTPLVERQLCEKLGVSRTPVREALRDLAGEGMVEIIEGKGVYVKKIEFKDMLELFELREALEGMAIQLFVERMDEDDLGNLQELMEEQEEAYSKDNHEEFMKIDMKIHNLIAEGARNQRLKNSISSIYDQISQLAILVKDDTRVRDMAIRAHRKMIDAVTNRDAEAARKAIVEHINEVKELHKDRYYLF